MKKFLALALIATMILTLFVGCNKGDKSAKDTLTVAIGSDPSSLDAQGKNDSASTTVKHQIYDTLLKQGKDGPEAGLVESWEHKDDTTLLLKVRKNVKFHNGNPLKADDILFSISRAFDSSFANWMVATVDIPSCKVVDEYTVEVKLSRPTGALLSQLCFLYVVDKETVEGGTNLEETPIGTGPFVFDKWYRSDRIELSTNADYWGTVAPFKKLTMRVISEASSRAMEIEAGGVDIATLIANNDIEGLKSNKDVQVMSTASYSNTFIGLNCLEGPFTSKELRQAVNYALDRQAIVKAIYGNSATVANGPIAPTIWGYNPDVKGYTRDVAKAKELMAQAGYPNGLEITMTVSDSTERVDIATMVQNQLKEIGITVKVNTFENATYLDGIINADYEMFVLGWVTNTGDADYGMYEPFYTGMPTWANTAQYSNPEVDALLDIGQQSTDPSVRLDAYYKAQEMIVDDAPWVFLCNKQETAACRSNIKGFEVPPSGRYEFNTITFG